MAGWLELLGMGAAAVAQQIFAARSSPPPLPEPLEPLEPLSFDELPAFNLTPTAPTAEADVDGLERPSEPPAELFSDIEGHDDVKTVLRRALASKEPTHVLLVSPPGGAKTMFLRDIASLPGGRYTVAGSTSAAGLRGFLLENPDLKYLCVDEIDKAPTRDLDVLLSLMEGGIVTELKADKDNLAYRKVWVFAAANSTDKIRHASLSRFMVIRMPAYTEAQFRQIAQSVLTKREHLDPELADQIVASVQRRSRDPRKAVAVARLTSGPDQDRAELDRLVALVVEGDQEAIAAGVSKPEKYSGNNSGNIPENSPDANYHEKSGGNSPAKPEAGDAG